jgi:hypothetical protein
MRIAGYIDHPELKITIFHYQNRYSLKFENALFEQTFKLRAQDADDLFIIRKMVDEHFLNVVQLRFDDMAQQMMTVKNSMHPDNDSDFEFPEII